jgi:hypothetical protein
MDENVPRPDKSSSGVNRQSTYACLAAAVGCSGWVGRPVAQIG